MGKRNMDPFGTLYDTKAQAYQYGWKAAEKLYTRITLFGAVFLLMVWALWALADGEIIPAFVRGFVGVQ